MHFTSLPKRLRDLDRTEGSGLSLFLFVLKHALDVVTVLSHQAQLKHLLPKFLDSFVLVFLLLEQLRDT